MMDTEVQRERPSQSNVSLVLQEIYKLTILILFVFVIRASVLGMYVIPSGSMLPTIKIDDRLIANKLSYGLILPLTDTQVLSWASPKRGDIVMFQSPESDVTFVKRVMGIEGDVLKFSRGVLQINGQSVSEVELTDRQILEDMGEGAEDRTLFTESDYGGGAHLILRQTTGGATFFESREFAVPTGKVFVLGDNRDGSNDSRGWGFVDAKKVQGKAFSVFYSTIRHEAWYPKFRSDRFFKPLQ